jgi:hypothetical protein
VGRSSCEVVKCMLLLSDVNRNRTVSIHFSKNFKYEIIQIKDQHNTLFIGRHTELTLIVLYNLYIYIYIYCQHHTQIL